MAEAKDQVTVSVIVVMYDSEKEIGACLESVMPQVETAGGEVIVVDNGSTDQTLKKIEPRITRIEPRRHGGTERTTDYTDKRENNDSCSGPHRG